MLFNYIKASIMYEIINSQIFQITYKVIVTLLISIMVIVELVNRWSYYF